jgi:Zn-dependent protease
VVSGGVRIGRIFGIPILLHGSWFIIFALITFSLASHYRSDHPNWSEAQHWLAGLAASLLFFGSVVFHELAHSVTAQHYRIPVLSITLFVFGGVARIGRESENWRQEFNIAAAGPASSYFLAGVFFFVTLLFPYTHFLGALASWLMQINFLLATFNLVPGFPLDGGRIFRALVWGATGSFAQATKFAARGGQWIAYGMILFGVWRAVKGEWMAGLWLAFIGWFLLTAAQESYAQVAVREMLRGMRARDVMSRELPIVPRHITLEEYVHELLRTGRRCHLVEADGRIIGLISVHSVNAVPREEWATTSVQAAMLPREQVHTTHPDMPVLLILEKMQNEDINQMPVVASVDGVERVVGLVTREAILRVIQTRMEVGVLAEQ